MLGRYWGSEFLGDLTDFFLYIDIGYILGMLRTITDKTTQDVYDGIISRYARKLPNDLHGKACRLLDQLNAAPSVEFLRVPPSNRLEKLKGDLAGYWSLRISDQWRIFFHWEGSDAFDAEIIDYHR